MTNAPHDLQFDNRPDSFSFVIKVVAGQMTKFE